MFRLVSASMTLSILLLSITLSILLQRIHLSLRLGFVVHLKQLVYRIKMQYLMRLTIKFINPLILSLFMFLPCINSVAADSAYLYQDTRAEGRGRIARHQRRLLLVEIEKGIVQYQTYVNQGLVFI